VNLHHRWLLEQTLVQPQVPLSQKGDLHPQ
jgi:hypothetical protein